MNPNGREPDENQFADLLAAYDEVLAAGLPADTPAASGVDSDLLPRLQSAQNFLRRLEQHWPRASAGTTPVPTQVHGISSLSFDAMSGSGQLGRFQLIRELGRGGHGIVFLAFDPVLQRQVALKVARPEVLESAGIRHRFQQEARAAAWLSHPNLVPVHDTGEVGPFCYIVSAYCAGPTLAAWLKEHPDLPAPKAAASLVLRLAEAVATIHGRSILHRDIKPSNVLLELSAPASPPRPEGVSGMPGVIPKLTDFGLAKCLDGAGSDTVSGAVLGTPAYMAPEQAQGQRERVGFGADVYGLGAVLYEMLTGVPPFQGATRLDTLRLVTSEEPRPPRRLRADLPVALETICLKCLEKEPGQRYGTAQALAEDLQCFLQEKPIRARPPGLLRRIRKWGWGQRVAAGLVALGLIGAMALAWWHYEYSTNQERVEPPIIGEPKDRNRDENYPRGIQQARDAISGDQVLLAVDILNKLRPAVGDKDPRGFEWYFLWRACRPMHAHLGSHDRTVKIRDVFKLPRPLNLRGHNAEVWAVAFAPDDQTVASGGDDHTVRLWEPATGKQRQILGRHGSLVACVAFSPDGNLLAAGDFDHLIKVWEVRTGKLKHTLAGHKSPVMCVVFSPDGKFLATGSRDNTAKLWHVQTGKERVTLRGHKGSVNALVFSPDGKTLASGSHDQSIRFWDIKTGNKGQGFDDTGPVNCLTFTKKGQTLVSANLGGSVSLWDIKTGRRKEFQAHPDKICSLALTPDGRTLATTGWDKTIKLWHLGTRTELLTLEGHQGKVECVAFSPNGRTLASASHDQTVKLWHAATKAETERLDP